jgi:hypothetical protein
MKNPWLLVVLLLAATLLVDLVALSTVFSDRELGPPPPHWADVCLISLAMSQVSLVAIWTGLGGRSLPWRVLALVATIVAWARLLAWSYLEPEATPWRQAVNNLMLAAQSACVLLPLFVVRFTGLELTRTGDAQRTERTAAGRSRLQFSLRYLLSWITVLAVVLGLFQYAFDYRQLPALTPIWRELAAVSLGNVALTLAAIWVALAARRPVLRAVVLALTTAAVVAAYNTVGCGDPYWPCAAVCVLQVVWLVSSLWVFRVAGYRIVWFNQKV